MEFKHYPVLLEETIEYLKIRPEGIFVDATFGGGSHSAEILKRTAKAKVIGIDQDIDAVNNANEKYSDYINEGRLIIVKDNFKNIKEIIKNLGYQYIDGAILDLGVSSYQIDTKEKGFSYMQDAPLDMRMDRNSSLDAKYVVNKFEAAKLKEILYEYGEENFADLIVKNIVRRRSEKEIDSTLELSAVITEAVKNVRYKSGHPSKKTFQAIRIFVNDELNIIAPALYDFVDLMMPESRISVITFHSLEDRIVKKTFSDMEKSCICPPDFPICVCAKKKLANVITKKPVLPGEKELMENSRSNSAKLRVAEKI